MPNAEEKFRVLLSRLGISPSRSVIVQAFRLDASLAEILPWIVDNVTADNIIDPQLRLDCDSPEGRLSLPLSQDEAAGDFEILSEEDEEEMARIEREVEMEISEIDDEIVFLEKLAGQLEEQIEVTEERNEFATREEREYLSKIVEGAESRAMEASKELDAKLEEYQSALTDFGDSMSTAWSQILITQFKPGMCWKESDLLFSNLSRLASQVVDSLNYFGARKPLTRKLMELSDFESREWFIELERLRQYKQASEVRRVEILLNKTRMESRSQELQKLVHEFARNPSSHFCNCLVRSPNAALGSLWELRNNISTDELLEKNKRLMQKKQSMLTETLPPLISKMHQHMGLDPMKEYVGRLLEEWDKISYQKQELMKLVCEALDRNRLFTMLAEIERCKMQQLIDYLKENERTATLSGKAIENRVRLLAESSSRSVDFLRPEDQFLQQIAGLINFCSEAAEESQAMRMLESSMLSQNKIQKRIRSAAFSENEGYNSNLSPVSKFIRDEPKQHIHITPHSQVSTPAELESSLRRLSVEPDDHPMFGDSPEKEIPRVPIHEITLQSNRLLSLSKASHQAVVNLVEEEIESQSAKASTTVSDVIDKMFQKSEDRLVLAAPNLKPTLEGLRSLIEELNQISSTQKNAFKEFSGYLDRHPEEAEFRHGLIRSVLKGSNVGHV